MNNIIPVGLQKTFSKNYASTLRRKVKDGIIDQYKEDVFQVDDTNNNVYKLQGVFAHVAELDASKSDYENAIAFYEAHPEITPFLASNEAFWAHLTHVEYFDYVTNRWFNEEKNYTPTLILRRFFYTGSSNAMDNALSRLWWSVYLTKDDTLDDPYMYTKVILASGNSDLLQNLSKSKLYRLKDASHGILRFFSEYSSRTEFSAVNRYIIQYFNRYSGVKQLVFMGENFFYETSKKALEFYNRKKLAQ